jgi:SSS family solute:Na+ symporter
MTSYDYAVLVFYFGFMLAIGWVFRRFVTSVSDYVRGGGKALWWMVGGSAFMVAFSAWTFTGAAGEAYRTGWPIAIIYLGNIAGFVLNALHFGPRFRQMRVVTGVEAIRKRFGKASEQVFTWLQIPLGTLQAGIWLNALGVFFSTVLGLDVATTITVTGAVVVCMALVGGSWAVLASDFIQVLILMPVCAAVTVLVLVRAGGVGAFVEQVPAGHLDLGQLTSTPFLALWGLAMICKQITSTNNLADAGRYLCAKDGSHARKAGFLGAGLFVIGIVIWFVPPMAARFLLPDLASAYPGLKNPSEAAYLAMARDVMPVGMMGLLVSGIFAATMSSMDAGLNKNAGVFVKNFYQPQISPGANDRQLLRVGKIATLVLGGVVIAVAHWMNSRQELGLFLLMQRITILVAVPVTVPLLLGLIVERTPPWSAWSTVLVGFCCALAVGPLLPPAWAVRILNDGQPLVGPEKEYWTQGSQFFVIVLVSSTWFLLTRYGWTRVAPGQRAEVEQFHARLREPVDFAAEEGEANANDARQSRVVGILCLIYGGVVSGLVFIPNPWPGRLAFLGCGGLVLFIGWLLRRSAVRPASS